VSTRGAPTFLRSDNGQLCCRGSLGIGTALIEPGKPWQNAVAESFNGKFRDECLSLEWLRSRADAKVIIETWRRHYNEVRSAFEPRDNYQRILPRSRRRARIAPCKSENRGDLVRPNGGPNTHYL
jgi:Integrase core domain